jgi:hypothetical protein
MQWKREAEMVVRFVCRVLREGSLEVEEGQGRAMLKSCHTQYTQRTFDASAEGFDKRTDDNEGDGCPKEVKQEPATA